MAYTDKNFKTKKALVEAVKAGEQVTVYQPGPFGPSVPDGTAYLEGPHYPEPHRWYASVEVRGGVIVGRVR
jgi:hypothetical protein